MGISGASGAIYGIRLLEVLREVGEIEIHLVVSSAAKLTISLETDYSLEAVEALADRAYRPGDIAAPISSGSFKTMGMVVAPCSMKTVSGIANSYSDNLLLRAADVVLKERRRLVLLPRETPLHLGHLRLLTQVTEMGANRHAADTGLLPSAAEDRGDRGSDDQPGAGSAGYRARRRSVRALAGSAIDSGVSELHQEDMSKLRPRLLAFLYQHDTMTLATIGPAGEPQAAAVFYVADDELDLYFLSDPDSRHGRNLTREPRVAATIQADGQDWQEITGLQIEGTATVVEEANEIARVAQLFAKRFDFLRELLADGDAVGAPDLQGPLASGRFYAVRPTWIRSIDNTRGFGHKEELTLE